MEIYKRLRENDEKSHLFEKKVGLKIELPVYTCYFEVHYRDPTSEDHFI